MLVSYPRASYGAEEWLPAIWHAAGVARARMSDMGVGWLLSQLVPLAGQGSDDCRADMTSWVRRSHGLG
jgi:hypothetical protein